MYYIVVLGYWYVGNIGRERGSIWIPLALTYAAYPTYYYISDESTWFSLLVVIAGLSFDTFSKEWRLQPKKKRSKLRRFTVFAVAALIYTSAWGSFFYFNAMITDDEGEPIKLTEAFKHLFTSPIWLEFKVSEATKDFTGWRREDWNYYCFNFIDELVGDLGAVQGSGLLGDLETDRWTLRSQRRNQCL